PTSDQQVLERLPSKAGDARAREFADLRRQLAARPDDLGLAVKLAHRYFDEVAAEGDPRYIGYAQAALRPWWDQPAPPPEVRVMRAMLRQFSHQFEPAVADLQAAVAARPDLYEGWAWLAAIAMVQARYGDARPACERLGVLGDPLSGTACIAMIDATTGQAALAVRKLAEAADAAASVPGNQPQQLWILTRLAEAHLRLGQTREAEATFRRALALGLTDGYLLAAYGDLLLDLKRPAEVLTLLRGRERSDLLLLRLAIAARQTQAPELASWTADLRARFDDARLRGDTVHQKEEARFAREVLGELPRALSLAVANFDVQREPVDARVLMECALAAGQPAAARPALEWMSRSGIESPQLQALARQLGAPAAALAASQGGKP
ncbi:MAG: hypothetical protein RL722_2586, partial [Pseudomonadota bacterium]